MEAPSPRRCSSGSTTRLPPPEYIHARQLHGLAWSGTCCAEASDTQRTSKNATKAHTRRRTSRATSAASVCFGRCPRCRLRYAGHQNVRAEPKPAIQSKPETVHPVAMRNPRRPPQTLASVREPRNPCAIRFLPLWEVGCSPDTGTAEPKGITPIVVSGFGLRGGTTPHGVRRCALRTAVPDPATLPSVTLPTRATHRIGLFRRPTDLREHDESTNRRTAPLPRCGSVSIVVGFPLLFHRRHLSARARHRRAAPGTLRR